MSRVIRETSTAVTQGIRIEVRCRFLPDQSSPVARRYAFAYTVRIRNEGVVSVQLLSRRWAITDSRGKVQEVRGAGVVGEQPILHPGQSFEYTSSALIETSLGEMRGSYRMHSVTGRTFDAVIAPFLLSLPHALN
ncbi:MAG: Co2+/Mg2+ efflux protein ApaG [Polyangiales bacterium]